MKWNICVSSTVYTKLSQYINKNKYIESIWICGVIKVYCWVDYEIFPTKKDKRESWCLIYSWNFSGLRLNLVSNWSSLICRRYFTNASLHSQIRMCSCGIILWGFHNQLNRWVIHLITFYLYVRKGFPI